MKEEVKQVVVLLKDLIGSFAPGQVLSSVNQNLISQIWGLFESKNID